MKTKLTITFLALSAGSLCAQTTTWFHGGTNNSALFGVTPDSSAAITWQDNWAGLSNFDTARFGSEALQTNRPNTLGQQQSAMLYGFGGLGISSALVSEALLYLRQDFSSAAQTWTIQGLAPANVLSWDTANMTANDIDTGNVADWSGGNLFGSFTGSYGTFNTAGGGTDANISVDITLALKDYLNGTITGIAFVNPTNGVTFSANDNRLVVFSNDNLTATNRPGLLVTAVPEPSAALLGGLGALLLFRRRR